MSEVFAILSLGVALFPIVQKEISKYQKQKKVKEELYFALQKKIDSYQMSFEKVLKIYPDKILPALEPFEDDHPTKKAIEDLAEALIEMGLAYSNWINQFIAITKGFKVLYSTNPDFIEYLGKSNEFLKEFVIQIGNLHKSNKLYLNEGFFIFSNIHRKKLKKFLNKKETQKAIDEGKIELEFVLKKVMPAMARIGVSRKTAKRYLCSVNAMHRANKKVSVTKELQNNLDEYVFPELKPLIVFIDEHKLSV